MNREFLELYNRELQYLEDAAAEFAREYPGVAERLGGVTGEYADPAVAGLLEGAAFLAARVQLKLKHEFPEFTSNLLELLLPSYLAPIPSVLLAAVRPAFDDANLRKGIRIERGNYVDATFVERDHRIACRYRLVGDITLWPLDIASASYLAGPGPLEALGVGVGSDVAAGLRLGLVHRTAPPGAAKAPEPENREEEDPKTWLSALPVSALDVHLVGQMPDRLGLYEQLFGHLTAIHVRWLDRFGDPKSFEIPKDHIAQLGFGEDDDLIGDGNRTFEGFRLLRDYFIFPDKYLGFRLTGLDRVLRRLDVTEADLVFCFDEVNPRLATAVRASTFSLYTAPAVNLFDKTLDRIPVKPNQFEYHVVPERSNYLNYEPYAIRKVYAHYQGASSKVPVQPLYSAAPDAGEADGTLFYTARRLPRRRSADERRFGTLSNYVGTDMFLSLYEPARIDGDRSVAELSVSALCSNRHLTEHLPVGEGGADFRFVNNVALDVQCVAGPTPPREPVVAYQRGRTEAHWTGSVAWRLINFLGLSHLGLTRRAAGRNGEALRELVALFADASTKSSERAVRGIREVDSRPVVRRLTRANGTGIGRGLEITVTLDEKAFDASEAFLFGAVLERFFAEYASLNTFTCTVVESADRGTLMRWPPRAGARNTL